MTEISKKRIAIVGAGPAGRTVLTEAMAKTLQEHTVEIIDIEDPESLAKLRARYELDPEVAEKIHERGIVIVGSTGSNDDLSKLKTERLEVINKEFKLLPSSGQIRESRTDKRAKARKKRKKLNRNKQYGKR